MLEQKLIADMITFGIYFIFCSIFLQQTVVSSPAETKKRMNFAHTLTTPASSCRPQPAAEPAHYYIIVNLYSSYLLRKHQMVNS